MSVLLLTWLAKPRGMTSPLESSPAQLRASPLDAEQGNPPAVAGGTASPKRRTAADRATDTPVNDRNGIVTLRRHGRHRSPLPAYPTGQAPHAKSRPAGSSPGFRSAQGTPG